MDDYETDMQSYVGFGFHDDNLMIVNDYGNFKTVELNLTGGKCKKVQEEVELLGADEKEKDQADEDLE